MKTVTASLVVGLLASCFTLTPADRTLAQEVDCPNAPPLMTIKIFNRDPDNYIFPVLTMGKDTVDVWMQACFKIAKKDIDTHPYPRTKNFRLYLFPTGGIKPWKQPNDPVSSINVTLPLYTKMAQTVVPTQPDQFINWWSGGTIQLYSSKTSTPPRALTEAQSALSQPKQMAVVPLLGSVVPICVGCGPQLTIYSDETDLPKSDPSQLVEFTLGARVALQVKVDTDPPNTLDFENVDFDVSYVNTAFLGAAMGPYKNDQVGYVGTPLSVANFQKATVNFLRDFHDWPQFVKIYANGAKETILKIPSPLEIFPKIRADLLPPPDLEPLDCLGCSWPTKVWPPIQALRDNWVNFAGKFNANGKCRATPLKNSFCDAIVDARKLIKANYDNYRKIFSSKCNGTPVDLSDDLMISHVYGWTPFTEAKTGTGCLADDNLLQNTPGYSKGVAPNIDYSEYARVKQAFDELNYDKRKDSKYPFNPWVVYIHGDKYVNAPNVYAYSVDDAVGNVQADALGFIIDVGGLQDLENQTPAAPPINVNYALSDKTINFTHYRVCVNDEAHQKPVRSFFRSFIISPKNPENCPIFFLDNKSPPQLYTFKLTKAPPYFLATDSSKEAWNADTTAKPIDCLANGGPPPYQPSSRNWCCGLLTQGGAGVRAFSKPEPFSAHSSLSHFANVDEAMQTTTFNVTRPCNGGQPITTSTAPLSTSTVRRR